MKNYISRYFCKNWIDYPTFETKKLKILTHENRLRWRLIIQSNGEIDEGVTNRI